MTWSTFCHWRPLLQKVGAVVTLFSVDLLLAVGADGEVLTIPHNRAASTQKDAAVLGVLSHTLSPHQEGNEQSVPGPWQAVLSAWMSALVASVYRKGNFVSLFMFVVCMPVHKCIGEHVCVCIYMWRAEADIGTPQYLCVVYTEACFIHLNLELASGAILASQLAQGSLSPKSWDYSGPPYLSGICPLLKTLA